MNQQFKNTILYHIYRILSSKNKFKFKKFVNDLKKYCKGNECLEKFYNYFSINWIPYEEQITQIIRTNNFGINSTNNIAECRFKHLTREIKQSTKKERRIDRLIDKIIKILDTDYKRSKNSNFIPGYIDQLDHNNLISKKYFVKKITNEKNIKKILEKNLNTETQYVEMDDNENNIKIIEKLKIGEKLDEDEYVTNILNLDNDDINNTIDDDEEMNENENEHEHDCEDDKCDHLNNLYCVAREYGDKKKSVVYNFVNLKTCDCSCKSYYIFARPCSHIYAAIHYQFKGILEKNEIKDSLDLLNASYVFNNFDNVIFRNELLNIKNNKSSLTNIPITNINALENLNKKNKRKNIGNTGNSYTRNNEKEFNTKRIISKIIGLKIEKGLFLYCDIENAKNPAYVPYNEKEIIQKQLINEFLNLIENDLLNFEDKNIQHCKKICQVLVNTENEVIYYFNQKIRDTVNSESSGKIIYKNPTLIPTQKIIKNKNGKDFINSVKELIK